MEHTHEPAPSIKAISGILALPPEIYEIIIVNLYQDKRSICNLASTNRRLYSFLGPFRFRDVTIRLGFEFFTRRPEAPKKAPWYRRQKKQNLPERYPRVSISSEVIPDLPMHNYLLNDLANLISSPIMLKNLQAIRSVTIQDECSTGLTAPKYAHDERLKSQWSLVKRILQGAIDLDRFCYDCYLPFPVELLAFLETEKPYTKIEILNWFHGCGGPSIDDRFLLAIGKSPSLTTITLGEVRCRNCCGNAAFGRIIRESPNLRIIRYGSGIRNQHRITRNLCCQYYVSESDPWDLRNNPPRSIAFFNTTTPCLKAVEELKIASRQNETYLRFPSDNFWQSCLDVSKLKILDLSSSNAFLDFERLSISNTLTSLRKLSFTCTKHVRIDTAIYAFLDGCSLEALAVFSNYPLDIERLLSAQVDTLNFLLVKWCLTANDLHFIRDQCKSLQFLGTGARLPHQEPRVYNALVTLKNLYCLRLQINDLSLRNDLYYNDTDDEFIDDEDWRCFALAERNHKGPNENAIKFVWNVLASKWCSNLLPKVAIRSEYLLTFRGKSTPRPRDTCDASWVIEPKYQARPGSIDADFYRGFDVVGFENYKVASFPDAELDYPKIPMPYDDRVNKQFHF